MSHRSAFRLTLLAVGILATACQPETTPVGVTQPASPSFAALFGDGPAETCAAGGYITRVYVDPATTLAGDGWHFTRITDAVAAVRSGRINRGEKTVATAACRITIEVAPGTYTGGFSASAVNEVFPLVLDVPRVTLQGGLRMALDGYGRATGVVQDEAQVSALQPSAPLTSTQSLIIVTDSSNGLVGGVNDTHGDEVTVRGFELRSGYSVPNSLLAGGGLAIVTMRVLGLRVEENRFGFLLASAVDARASSGVITHNSAIDLGNALCTFCLAGPGDYTVTENSVLRSGIVGVYVVAATQSPLPVGVTPLATPLNPAVTSTIHNDFISGELQHPVGTAIRISPIGQGFGNSAGNQASATVTSNDLVQNRFGIIADGGFPTLNTNAATPSGNLTLTLGGNIFSQSCQANLLVSLARHTRGLGLSTGAGNGGYLKNSIYTINLGGNLPWSEVWFAHPAVDKGISLNNTLLVDNAPIGNGALNAYHGIECGFRPSANVWLGLKTSDDVGTKFDLQTEFRRNGVLVATGQVNNANGGSSGFNNAVERTIATSLKGVVAVKKGDLLEVTVLARIAEGVSGHTSGTARLWYGGGSANSRIITQVKMVVDTLVDTLSRPLYLAPLSQLTDAPGTGTPKTLDLFVTKNNGNPFKPVGTWSRQF